MMVKSTTSILALAIVTGKVAGFEDEASWKPSQQTQVATNGHENGFSPKPTEAPFHPRYGMMKRDDVGFALSTETNQCGWWSSKAGIYSTLGCVSATDKCITSGSHLGCCQGNCQYGVVTKCLNYNQVKASGCPTDDPNVMCCTRTSVPGCWTWRLPIDRKGASSTYTMVNCDYSQGAGILFATNPAEESTKTTSQSTNTAADATNTSFSDNNVDGENGDDENNGSKKKKTNVGAIAGGVVGGLGAAALIGVAIMLFIRRSKAKKNNEPASQPTGDSKAPVTSAPSTPGYTHGNMQQWSPAPQQGYAYPPPQQGYPTPPPNGQYDPQAIPAAYHPGQTPSPQGFDPKMSPGNFQPGQTPSPQGFDPRAAYMGQSPPPQQPSPYSPHSPSTGYGYPASVSAAGVTQDGASQLHGTPQNAPIELAGHEAAAHSVPVELGAENPQK